jgi:hypothetical protein
MKHEDIKMDKKVAKKAIGMHDKQMHGGKKTNLASLKKGGMAKGYSAGGATASGKIRRGPKTSSAERLYNANLSQSDSDIAPNLKPRSTSEDRLASANKKQMNSNIGPNLKSKRARSDGSLQATYDEPKQSFGDAFKEARKENKKTFMHNGKSYTTETAEEKDKSKAKPTPTGNIGSRTMLDEGETAPTFKRGGKPKCMAKGGGIESRGKTRGRFC